MQTKSGAIKFLVYALANQNDGKAHNPENLDTPLSSARLYDNIFIRHWDFYIEKERNAIFAGTILNPKGHGYSFDNKLKNLLFGWADAEKFITLPESPIPPFGDAGDYDLSPDGSTVAFVTKAPELPKANYTASYVYLVPHDGSKLPAKVNGPDTTAPNTARGASSAPTWSRDGRKLAYGQMDGVTYESDRTKLYIYDVKSHKIINLLTKWEYSIGSIAWSSRSDSLYLGNDFQGATRLFVLPINSPPTFEPKNLTSIETISGYSVLPSGNVFIAATAIWTSSLWYVLDIKSNKQRILFSANKVDAELAGLTPSGLRDFWYEGYEGDKQHSWIVLPTGFDESKKYPVIFYVHGGPQGYTGNSWSSRWNLRTWADQGYILIGPNPTGSTSYGQPLTDRIQEQWGGRPYQDLINAWTYVKENIPYADTSNAVAAGASYGCYMMNWIQGHDLGREFKALVCHDGKVSTLTNYGTEELWFIEHDNNGTIWTDEKPSQDPDEGYSDDVAFVGTNPNYSRWSPSRYAANFATPQFIIHSERDYRVPISEGIFTFNVLQSKGIPSRFLTFPDETHWVVNRENSLVWHTEIYNWINFWSGKTDKLDSARVIRQ